VGYQDRYCYFPKRNSYSDYFVCGCVYWCACVCVCVVVLLTVALLPRSCYLPTLELEYLVFVSIGPYSTSTHSDSNPTRSDISYYCCLTVSSHYYVHDKNYTPLCKQSRFGHISQISCSYIPIVVVKINL